MNLLPVRQLAGHEKSLQQLAFAAHIFRGMSLNLGANVLGNLCQDLETLATGGNTLAIPALLPKIEAAFKQTSAEFARIRSGQQ